MDKRKQGNEELSPNLMISEVSDGHDASDGPDATDKPSRISAIPQLRTDRQTDLIIAALVRFNIKRGEGE